MQSKYLKVFADVRIPVDYASTQTYALLAKRDGGKTYATLLFEEQLCDAGLFFVTLDPVGKHWALRAGADGSEKGGKPDVWVLGGSHGDVPLEASSGELIADVVVDHPGRYILDVSGFETDAEQDRFALAFGKRLFRRKQRDQSFPLTLILEEAESFIPERPQPGQQPMLGAYGRIMRQGRNYGLGMWMVAQRAQALNKGVLSQAEVLVAKQMAHPRDIDAVDAWVKANGTPEQRAEMLASIASLEQNEAYVWSPAWLRTFKRTRVPQRVTFDSSASVKGNQKMKQVALVPLDVDALGDQIAATAERAKADDPKALRERIRQLERAYDELAKTQPTKPVEVPVVPEEFYKLVFNGLWDIGERAEAAAKAAQDALAGLSDDVTRRVEAIAREGEKFKTARPVAPAPTGRRAPPPRPEPPSLPAARESSVAQTNGDFRVVPAQQRILDSLAMLEAIGVGQADKTQLALFAGTKPTSGGYKNNLGALRNRGRLIHYPAPGTVALTDEGRTIADGTQAPGSTAELHGLVRSLVPPAHWALLSELIAAYPEPLSRDELGDRVGVPTTSGGFKNNLGRLRSLGLIDYPEPNWVVALPVLFLEDAAMAAAA